MLEQSLKDEAGWIETLAFALPLSYTREAVVSPASGGPDRRMRGDPLGAEPIRVAPNL